MIIISYILHLKKCLIKYSDNIMIYHYNTRGKKFLLNTLIKYSDNIMIYYYITGERTNSYLMKYSDNIMIYQYVTGEEEILN